MINKTISTLGAVLSSALTLTLFSSVFIYAGNKYEQAFNKAVGFPDGLYEVDVFTSAIRGFEFIQTPFMKFFLSIYMACAIIFCLVLIYDAVMDVYNDFFSKKNIKVKETNLFNQYTKDVSEKSLSKKIMMVTFLVLLFVLLFVLPLTFLKVYSEKIQGFAIEDSKKIFDNLKNEGSKTISFEKSSISGAVVKCTSGFCSIYDKDSNSIMIRPISDIKSIVSEPLSLKSGNK